MASNRFCDVPIPHITTLWPQVRPYIVKALTRDEAGRFLPNDILRILLESRAKLWISWDPETKTVEAAVVTEIIDYPQKREFRIWFVGGRNMRAWATEGRLMVEAYARAQGCDIAAGAMRRGWVRVAGDGWKETGVMLEKRL